MSKVVIRNKFNSRSKLQRKTNSNTNLSPLVFNEDTPIPIRKNQTHLASMTNSPYAIPNPGTFQSHAKSRSKISLGPQLKQKPILHASLSYETKSSLHQSFSNSLIEDYKGNYEKADRLLIKFNKMIKANTLKDKKEENLNVCRLILDELISYEKAFAPLLGKIKDQYEMCIKEKLAENGTMVIQVKELNSLNCLLSSEISKLLKEKEEILSKSQYCHNISNKAAGLSSRESQDNNIKKNQ